MGYSFIRWVQQFMEKVSSLLRNPRCDAEYVGNSEKIKSNFEVHLRIT